MKKVGMKEGERKSSYEYRHEFALHEISGKISTKLNSIREGLIRAIFYIIKYFYP